MNWDINIQGMVFNIQHFSIQDGAGVRTTVFLKGCPLRCKWCANPESQKMYPELAFAKTSCIRCQSCKKNDADGIISVGEDGEISVRPDGTEHPEHYAELCPAEALSVLGEKQTVAEVLKEVEKDAVFYRNSFGGLTVSGGEPLSQAEFTEALLREAKHRHIPTCIETTGYAPYEHFRAVLLQLDQVIMDIKLLDDGRHKEATGVSNKRILENFRRMCEEFPEKPILIRTPVIPGVNDRLEDIKEILGFIMPFPNVSYELLKFHRLGAGKYESLGRDWEIREKELDEVIWNEIVEYVKVWEEGRKRF